MVFLDTKGQLYVKCLIWIRQVSLTGNNFQPIYLLSHPDSSAVCVMQQSVYNMTGAVDLKQSVYSMTGAVDLTYQG